jgi:hypothetical protein
VTQLRPPVSMPRIAGVQPLLPLPL